jgi:hypothetical protein
MCPLDAPAIRLNLKAPAKLAKSIECQRILIVTTKWDKLRPDQVRPAEAVALIWPKMVEAAYSNFHKIEEDEHGTEGSRALEAVRHFTGDLDSLSPGNGLPDDIIIL